MHAQPRPPDSTTVGLKCPACFHPLKNLMVGPLAVDVCQGGCGGIWFDAFELQRADEPGEAVGERLVEIQRGETANVDPSRKRECPRCRGVKLKRHYFSPRRRVEVDTCPGCGGTWLDHGEIAAIRHEVSEAAADASLPRPVVTPAVIRYLYALRQPEREERTS